MLPCFADGRIVGRLPLRLPLWRRMGGGAVDLCRRLVNSRVRFPFVAGWVVVAAAMWFVVASASSPSRRCPLGRSCEAAGVWCPQIRRSVGFRCSGRGRRGVGGGLSLELLFPVLVFVSVRWLLALLWRRWGCGGKLVPGAGLPFRLYRSFFTGILEFVAVFFLALLSPSLAGRGGEGRRADQGGLPVVSPASRARDLRRVWWLDGGCGEEASWPCSFRVLRSRRWRRAADAVFFSMNEVRLSPWVVVVWVLPLRRWLALKFFSRRCGGPVLASLGDAVVQSSSTCSAAISCSFTCMLC